MPAKSQPIITLAGDLGSGKSTVCGRLEKALGWGRFSTGVIMRDMAAKRGISVLDMNALADQDPEIDKEIDSVFKSLGQTPKPLLVDSRMAWHFLPQSFKVRMTVNTRIAAQRVFEDPARVSEARESVEDVLKNLKERQARENVRYKATYGVEIRNPANYDLMIDTTMAQPDDVTALIIRLAKDYFDGKTPYAYWVSPQNLLPLQHIDEIDKPTLQEVHASIGRRGFDVLEPVDVVESDRSYFILNGHKRVSGALVSGLPFVPVIIKEQAAPAFHADHIKAWQEQHKFKFSALP